MGLAVWQPSFSWLLPVSLLTLVSGVICLWRAEGHSVRDLGLHRVASWRRNVGWGLFAGLILPILLLTMQAVNGWITLAPASLPMAGAAMVVLPEVVYMAFIAASEELVFRGYFLQRLSFGQATGLAMLSSSLLWALIHLPAMVDLGLSLVLVAIGMVTLIVWGVALRIGFLHTGNTLWFPFGLHYGYNFSCSLIAGFVTIAHHAPRWLVGHPSWGPESGLLGLLLWITVLVAIWWTTGQEGRANKSADELAKIG